LIEETLAKELVVPPSTRLYLYRNLLINEEYTVAKLGGVTIKWTLLADPAVEELLPTRESVFY